jgi:hypothetical protein
MAKRKIEWVRKLELPEQVQKMLQRFETATGLHDFGYTVTYYRNDAVFVQVQGICNIYILARLAQSSPDIYMELEATSHTFWKLRMFTSDHLVGRELSHFLPIVTQPLPADRPIADNEYAVINLKPA